MEYGFMTKRYKFTNKCYTCDASSSVGVNKNGDFALCTAKESSATSTYIKKAKDFGPTGPGLPGDARAAAQAASDAANEAMKQAQLAAQKADEAAKAAVDKYRSVNAGGAQAGTNEQLAEAHRLAEQIRAQEASKAAEAATAARNIAEKKYNVELKALRKQQLVTDRAEEILMRAEKAGEEARAAYTQAAARAAQAARDAAMAGAVAEARRLRKLRQTKWHLQQGLHSDVRLSLQNLRRMRLIRRTLQPTSRRFHRSQNLHCLHATPT
jgi:hypothetical protein